MPHLTELQAKHADDGVTVIAMTKEDTRGNTLDAVKAMVKDKSDIMGFTVAWDDAGKTNKAYMEATGSRGIPQSFVIDKQGRLAFMGHPMNLDEPLKKIIAGQWDPIKDSATFAEQLKVKRDAERAKYAEVRAIAAASQHSEKGKGAGALVEKWRAFVKKYPSAKEEFPDLHYNVLVAAGMYEDAASVGRQLVDKAVAEKDKTMLNQIAWSIVDPDRKLERRDLMLAMYGATVACNLTNYKDAPILDTLARAHFLSGGLDRAIELQELAVQYAHESMKEGLQAVLDEYKSSRSL